MQVRYWIFALMLFVVVNTAGMCAITPESQQAVSDTTTVPGLQEQLKAVDLAIKGAVEMGLASDPEIGQNQITVTVISKRVTLEGKVPSQHLKERAGKIAKATKHVVDVLNLIEVDESLKDKRFEFFPEDNPENQNDGKKEKKQQKVDDSNKDSEDNSDNEGEGSGEGRENLPKLPPQLPGNY